jgi:hypothetical protein
MHHVITVPKSRISRFIVNLCLGVSLLFEKERGGERERER